MSGPLEIIGEDDAPVCVDGICAVPTVQPAEPAEG